MGTGFSFSVWKHECHDRSSKLLRDGEQGRERGGDEEGK